VLQHLKGDKVIVFKRKEEKDKKRNGHRQFLTQIVIEGITAAGAKKSGPKKEAVAANTEEVGPKVKKVSKAKKKIQE
jgi:large subunit ribosomal protein L21